MIKESFKAAYNVALKLENDSDLEKFKDEIIIDAYQNGREQGIKVCLFKNRQTFYVCQHRRSDQFGYYLGHYSNSIISDEAYNHGFIPCGIVDDADIVVTTAEKIKQGLLEMLGIDF